MKIRVSIDKEIEISHLVFDYNGTLAIDGIIDEKICKKLIDLADIYNIYILTADTYGTVLQQCQNLPVEVESFSGLATQSKYEFVKKIGAEYCACFGNGANDIKMLDIAALSVAVLSKEGMSTQIINYSDIVVNSINDALDLFLKPNRIYADLRD